MRIKRTFAMAAGAGLVSIGLLASLPSLIYDGSGKPSAPGKGPGIFDSVETAAINDSLLKLGKTVSEKFQIGWVNNGPVEATTYAEFKELSTKLNQDAAYKEFHDGMSEIWIGNPAGTGGILTTPGDALNVRVNKLRDMEQLFRNFVQKLENSPGYSHEIFNYKEAQSAIAELPLMTAQMLSAERSLSPAALDDGRKKIMNDPNAKKLDVLLPKGGKPSEALRTIQAVAEEYGKITKDSAFKSAADEFGKTVVSYGYGGDACTITGQADVLGQSMFEKPDAYKKAVAAAQARADMQGINVANILSSTLKVVYDVGKSQNSGSKYRVCISAGKRLNDPLKP